MILFSHQIARFIILSSVLAVLPAHGLYAQGTDDNLTVFQIPLDDEDIEDAPDDGLTIIQQVPPNQQSQVQPNVNAQPPANEGLASPVGASDVESLGRLEQAQQDLSQDADVQSALAQSAGSDLFFDSEATLPEGEQIRREGVINVNPQLQPASRFVVVRENYNANNRKAVLASASRALDLGRFDAALQIYADLLKKNSRDPEVIMGRAIALQRLGRVDESVLAYNDFLALRPNDLNARINMLGLMGQGFPSVALRQLLDLREEHPSHAGVAAQTAVVYAQTRQYRQALSLLGVAAGLQPNNALHVFNMAVIADKAGDQRSAAKLYEQALEVDAIHSTSGVVPRDQVYDRLAQIR